jgi:glyoxylase-like metal-dependent hydrolase (beta-lactamase superfamily II)
MPARSAHTTPIAHICAALSLAALVGPGCRVTGRVPAEATLGQPVTGAALESLIDRPGPLVLEKVHGADWAVPLSGLLDLDHERARRAGLEERDEPIEINFYAIRHPQRGTFLVDSGVQRGLLDEGSLVDGMLGRFMHKERMKVVEDTATWLARQPAPPAGVFLTHLHLDHVLGLSDLPAHTPVYVGPGETEHHRFVNAFVQGTTDRALERHDLRTLRFGPAQGADAINALDVFGDGSLFALHVPGHTAGSLAFLARTTTGPVLLAGDASHTAWGWQNGVPPGDFTEDGPRGAASLAALQALVRRHPGTVVHPGHQSLPNQGVTGIADNSL